jgi:hypothetical protein
MRLTDAFLGHTGLGSVAKDSLHPERREGEQQGDAPRCAIKGSVPTRVRGDHSS